MQPDPMPTGLRDVLDPADVEQAPLAGGALRSAISQAMVKLYATYYGKGATQAKTYAFDNVVVTVLRDVLTTVEQTLLDAGREEQVRELRLAFQDALRPRFVDAVELLTGRPVESFMSQVDPQANLAAEIFILQAPE